MKTLLINKKILFGLLMFIVTLSNAQIELPKLNYSYGDLEPVIDAKTVEVHYSKHHATYVANLNKLLNEQKVKDLSLVQILANISKYPESVKNNAGGVYNHNIYWSNLTPKKNTKPSEKLQKAIVESYTSLDGLKSLLKKAGASRFGSGWAWLIVDENKKLKVCSTANQDNPLMDNAKDKGTPILAIDVWEHAYYLKYQNKRADYLNSIFDIVNWDDVSERYENALK